MKLFFLSYFVTFVKVMKILPLMQGKGSHLVMFLNLVDYELLCFF